MSETQSKTSTEVISAPTDGTNVSAVPVAKSRSGKKDTRSRTGCFTCRSRKIKCDERQGLCKNCERMNLTCKRPSVRSSLDYEERRVRRKILPSQEGDAPNLAAGRVVSCVKCRRARARCSQEKPACERCREKDFTCEYAGRQSSLDPGPSQSPDILTYEHEGLDPNDISEPTPQFGTGRSASAHVQFVSPINGSESHQTQAHLPSVSSIPPSLGMERSDLEVYTNAYFSYVHHGQANSFLHRGTLIGQLQDGTAPEPLLQAICAAASRFVVGGVTDLASLPEGTRQAAIWAEEARKSILLSEEVSYINAATAVILATHAINSGKFALASSLSSFATRQALLLGYHRETERTRLLPWLEREAQRRLMWSCLCVDRLLNAGVDDLIQLPTSRLQVSLPCEDHNFQLGYPCDSPYLTLIHDSQRQATSFANVSIMGLYVNIVVVKDEILRYVRSIRELWGQTPAPWDPTSGFARCLDLIRIWRERLPPQLELTPANLFARSANFQVSSLAVLHIWYRSCLWELHRIALPGFPESVDDLLLPSAPVGWVNQTQVSCVENARSLSDIYGMVDDLFYTHMFVDTTLPYITYESMRIQLQYASLQILSEEDRARERQMLSARFDTALAGIARMARFFRQAGIWQKEIRRMLMRHHIPVSVELSLEEQATGTSTPWHPWVKRMQDLRKLDAEPQQSLVQSNIDPLDWLALLPNNGAGGMMWEPSGQSQSQGGIDQIASLLGGADQLLGHSDVSRLLGGRWDEDWMAAGFLVGSEDVVP